MVNLLCSGSWYQPPVSAAHTPCLSSCNTWDAMPGILRALGLSTLGLSRVMCTGVLRWSPRPRRRRRPTRGRRWTARTGTARCWSRPGLPGRCAPCPREGGFSHHASRWLLKDAPAAPPYAHPRRSSVPPSPFLIAGAPPAFLSESPRSEFARCENQECSRVRTTDRKLLGF